MKNFRKITLGVLLTAILLPSFYSCSNEDSASRSSLSVNDESNYLFQNLESFNFQYVYANTEGNQTYNWREKFLDGVAIGFADATGAAAGVGSAQLLAGVVGAATAGTGYVVVSSVFAIGGAASGSRLAYCTLYPKNCRGTKSTTGSFNDAGGYGSSVKFDFQEPFNYVENFGILHNSLLENVYTLENGDKFELEWFKDNIENIDLVDYNMIYNSPQYRTVIENIENNSVSYVENGYAAEDLLNNYTKLGYMSENVNKVLLLYRNATSNIESFNDIKEITAFYVDEISNSNLTNDEKECLLSAFSVNIQSIYYWNNFEVN